MRLAIDLYSIRVNVNDSFNQFTSNKKILFKVLKYDLKSIIFNKGII